MSGWHRENPELVGTDADPWMRHESYRRACEEQRIGVYEPVDPDDLAYERAQAQWDREGKGGL